LKADESEPDWLMPEDQLNSVRVFRPEDPPSIWLE